MTERLHDRLLGREARGEVRQRVAVAGGVLPLGRGEEPVAQTCLAVERGAHAVHVDEVGADAQHAGEALCNGEALRVERTVDHRLALRAQERQRSARSRIGTVSRSAMSCSASRSSRKTSSVSVTASFSAW